MSTISEPGNLDLNEFLNMDDEEMDESIVEACLKAGELERQINLQQTNLEQISPLPLREPNDYVPNTQVSVKMEFSCSPERIVEPNMDYELDDVIEICSVHDSEDEDDNADGILSLINTKVAEKENKNKDTGDEDEEENVQLGMVMNDHNYSSQSDSSPIMLKDAGNNARQILNCETFSGTAENNESVPKKEASVIKEVADRDNNSEADEKEMEDIEEFMDIVLENDRRKSIAVVKPKMEPSNEPVPNETINETINNDPDLFCQNVMDAVAAEDAADEAAEESLAQKPTKSNQTKSNNTSLDTSNEKSDGETETCSFQSTCDIEIETPASNNDIESVNETIVENEMENKAEKSTEQITEKECEKEKEILIEPNDKENNELVSSENEFNSMNPEVGSQEICESENISNESITEKDTKESCNEAEIQKTISTTTENESSVDSSSNGLNEENTELLSLDENISEPLEALPFEDRFDQLDIEIEEARNSSTTLPLLKEITALVNEMHVDCAQFAMASTDISAKLNAYIVDKFQIFQAVARRCKNGSMKDQEQQTEIKFEKKHLRKLNKKDKRALLASTDSSSTSTSSSSSDELENVNKKKRIRKRRGSIQSQKNEPNAIDSIVENETLVNLNEQIQLDDNNTDALYDDGVSITKYLRSDIFSSATIKLNEQFSSSSPQPSSSSESSDVEATNTKNANEKEKAPEKKKKSKKKKSQKLSQADENDREVKRLINLDGLMKRHINAGSTKSSDMDKLKTKSQNQKQKTDDILEFLEKDLVKDALSSDDSVNENEDEVITEKQYLERYNEDLKQQLLNESSNDEMQGEESDNEFAPALSDDSDSGGGGNRSPLVDKFLKTFNIEDSEEESTEPIPEITTSTTSIPTANDAPTNMDKKTTESQSENNNNNINNKSAEIKDGSKEHNLSTISDNSDCELLNDSFIYRKRTQPKTLEKILNEAEKRKKLQKLDEDLISLSSESSEGSDVEAVDAEPAETKSRTIKPMLRPDQLQRETLKAQKMESERIRRLDKRQSMLSRVLKEHPEMNTNEHLVLDYIENSKTFVKVHPDLVKLLKPHQREGVRFMYDSVYGGVEALKKTQGSGCILAHCMGLGKTLQLIALMHTVVTFKELKTRKILVLCPKSTVMNWGDEILRWLYPLGTKNLKVFTFSDTSDINEKLEIMREWSTSKRAGCLLVGYEAFRTLVFYHTYKMRNNLDPKRLETIRETVASYLLEPGADLVVCDEGHIIKNSRSAISLAVAEIKTQKRIVLTGTPIQNNLKEYYSMVNFIKPLFLGTEKEFANMYANPIKNGQHKDSSKKDIKVMKMRSFVLHKKLSKFVQRKEAELLKTFLPKKFEYVLFVPMTDVQNKLYERILEDITSRTDSRGRSLITDYTCLRKIWTHPKVLEDAWKNAVNLSFKRNAKNNPSHSDDDQPDDIYDSQVGFMSVRNDWWRNLIAEKDLESILPSNKLRTMFEILRMCEENGDKCLIFSAFVAVLNVVEYFFQKLTSNDKETMSELHFPPGARSVWEPNKDYFRLDGKTSKSTRHEMIKRFNHPQNARARVFLISAKAGGQGINLIGANRVIILDTSWNPSNDQQNIFRVFRLGQKKNCYIYRLLAMGTMEEKVYSRSVTKQAMSFRVVDVQQIDRHYSMAELAELYTLTIPKFSERPTPVFPQDNILANLLRSFPDLVYKYHEHDSLLENKVEQELSEQDKIDAWDAYERDLQMNSQLTQMPNMEDLQNRLSQGQMPSYMPSGMGPMAGLDFQSLLNFRSGMNQAQTSASFMNPLLQQYSNLSNQQYLEILNNLRQFTSNAVSDKSAYSSAATYANMYGGVVPSVSPHHTSGGSMTPNANSTVMHPLNALNDLSMYGLGASSAATSMGQMSGQNSSSLYAPNATSGMSSAAVNSAAGMYANSAASYYDQYLQKYGYNLGGGSTGQVNSNLINNAANALSSFASSTAFQAPRSTPPQTAGRKSSTPDLIGYRSNNNMPTTSPSPSTSAASLATMMPTSIMPTSSIASTSNASPISSKSKNELERSSTPSNKTYNRPSSIRNSTSNAQQRQTPVPTSIFAATSNALISASPSVYATSKSTTRTTTPTTPAATTATTTPIATTKSNDPQIRVKDMGQLFSNSARAASLQAAANAVAKEMSQLKNKAMSNNSNNNNNRSKPPSEQSASRQIPTKTSNTAELLKARGEMQIIPTTNPPGTASISKQLSEMSPSISLTAVRNNNNNNANNATTTKTASNSALGSPSGNKNNRLNNNSSTTITSTGHTHRNAQQSPGTTQQNAAQNIQSKKSITNATLSNKMSTISKINANIEPNKKSSNSATKSPLTIMPTPTTSSGNNQNIKKSNYNASLTSTSTPAVATATPPQKGTASILRQQQLRKMPAAVSMPSSGTLINPLSIQSNNNSKTVTSIAGANSNNTPTTSNNLTNKAVAQLLYNSKKVAAEKQNFTIKNMPTSNTSNMVKIVANNNRRGNQSPITAKLTTGASTATTSAQIRTASPTTATNIVRKSLNNSGLQITAKSSSTTNLNTSTKTTLNTASNSFPVHLIRSNSALGSTNRSFSPANSSSSTGSVTVSAKSSSNQSTTVTPKIASVTSLNNSKTTAIKSIPNQATTAANAAAGLKRAATTVQLNPQSLKLLQEKRFVTTTPSTSSASATTAAMKTAAAASTLLQQKRLNAAGSAATQNQQIQQKIAIQRAVMRTAPKPTTADSNVVMQTVANRSSATPGITKFILERKRKVADANSKDAGNLSKRPKDF